MRDTEPMPVFEAEPAAAARPAPSRAVTITPLSGIALFSAGFMTAALLFMVTLGVWTQTQFSALHAEVRATRVAAESAVRAADRASLAAEAAQSALASNDPQPAPTPEPDTSDEP